MNKKVIRTDQRGFTLIELAMALLFIGFIMVFLISTLLAIMRIYNKGVWLTQINQAGRQINADIGESARFASNPQQRDNNRLCVGGVSYLWNTSKDISDGSAKNWYNPQDTGNENRTALRLVRINDPGSTYCIDTNKMPNRTDSAVNSLLGTGVAIQEFEVVNSSSLLSIQAIFSTEGDVQPVYSETEERWQCVEADGVFQAVSNQYCAFIDLNLVVLGRGR